ncbi:MAG TPA: zf-HC2 domain-containing protein [Thermomicrobiales bacterium]|nr:zf-HC2 domain-containing protein [Thermomicrobiales bacterium]
MVDQSIDEYALGVLDAPQRAAIERHLSRCASCAALVDSYRQTAAVLALAVPLASPPASARTALMTRIAATPQTAAPARSVYAGSLDALRTPTLPSSLVVDPSPTPPELQSAWWRVYAAPLATLPLLLALGLVAAWGLNNYSQLNDSANALAQRDMQIARLSSQLSNENNQGVANLVTSPSTQRYNLSSEINGASAGAQGVLLTNAQSGQAALQVSGLPSGIYTVFVQLDNGDMVPKTEFVVGELGSASTMVDLGGQVTDLKSVHIKPATTMTETDVAIDQRSDVLMMSFGPGISGESDTSVQKP